MSVERPRGKFKVTRNGRSFVTVPCGKCLACLMNKRSDWTFRLMQENNNIEQTSKFVTLTYDDESIPLTDEGLMTLRKSDLQNYFKRLRLYNNEKIKYYAVGEYGELTRRPHYHIILFGSDTDTDVIIAWTAYDRRKKEFIFKGKVDIGKVESRSIHYVTGYLIGKNFEFGEYDEKRVEKPFSIMSKGIGENYMLNAKWHKENEYFYVHSDNGNKLRLPRFYKEKIFNEEEKEREKERLEKLVDEEDIRLFEFINNERKTKDFNRRNKKVKL